ncbi:helix-turn-helix domain-containing protein [Limosilactobacillus reuteri]|uniref:helix-turn-helix domain-containing protein n=1 Tax=Limosilactobacillus reuteri TaxID=1598 RepID=UPI00214AA31A|nr:helix-turn-helix transcriptional regulator [Limosilactobacillus reuteri]UUW69438.1 helix-turn-helix transcriptional regulator [Limosilactobacillus reuteri]
MLWNRIQVQLNKRELSIYRLSKMTGIPMNTLYSYKNLGKEPPFKNMVKIADALDVSLDVFRERGETNDANKNS